MAPLVAVDSLAVLLDAGLTPVLLDSRGTPLSETLFPDRCLLLPGLEGPGIGGLQESTRTQVVTVSLTMMNIESYNATVACFLALYEWRRRQA